MPNEIQDRTDNMPTVRTIHGSVKQVNSAFSELTGYPPDHFQGRMLAELFSELRINTEETSCRPMRGFLFTRSYDVKCIEVEIQDGDNPKEGTYCFRPVHCSLLDEKIPFFEALVTDDSVGFAVFSVPDLVLLKANQQYIDFFDEPYRKKGKVLGLRKVEFTPGWKGSQAEAVWKSIAENGKPFKSSQFKHEGFERGVTYWETKLTPVSDHGIVKYCIVVSTEVTEKVLARKQNEEFTRTIAQQNRQLQAIPLYQGCRFRPGKLSCGQVFQSGWQRGAL